MVFRQVFSSIALFACANANALSAIESEQGDINTTEQRALWEQKLSNKTKKWHELDKKYFLQQNLSTPVLTILDRVEGIHIVDLDGKKIIDMHGNGVHNAGFHNPEVVQAVKDQLDTGLSFTPRRYSNIPAIKLAKKITEITPPGLNKVLFAPGGSEAIEMAIMLAKQVTGRFKTISYWDSYHGTTMGAAAIGGEELFQGGLGPMVPGAFHVEFPNYYRNPWGYTTQKEVDDECLRQMENVFEKNPDIAAVIGEPVSATPTVPSLYYWQGVRKLCDKYGAFLIFDEVITGFARSGKMFAASHFVVPDVLVMGKSLGGGLMPFAGIATKEKYDTLLHRSIGHYTHEKNPLCATAALAEINYLEKHNIASHAAQMGEYFKKQLNGLKKKHPIIGNVTGMGLHIGIDLISDPQKTKAVDVAEKVMFKAMEYGLAFKIIEGSVITLRPALIINESDIDQAVAIIDRSLSEATKV